MHSRFKETVYVVDDTPLIASSLAKALGTLNFEATAFTDPRAALEQVARSSPGFLVTDIMMAGMNGVELAIRVKSVAPDCHILLLSGFQDASEMLAEAESNGYSFAVCTKPLHPLVLAETLRGLCKEKHDQVTEPSIPSRQGS